MLNIDSLLIFQVSACFIFGVAPVVFCAIFRGYAIKISGHSFFGGLFMFLIYAPFLCLVVTILNKNREIGAASWAIGAYLSRVFLEDKAYRWARELRYRHSSRL